MNRITEYEYLFYLRIFYEQILLTPLYLVLGGKKYIFLLSNSPYVKLEKVIYMVDNTRTETRSVDDLFVLTPYQGQGVLSVPQWYSVGNLVSHLMNRNKLNPWCVG